jgi:glycosyltransferase involved in cell wall biosynthesis
MHGDQPTVSVVICTHKRPEFLRNCLDAVTNLQPPPSELIVIDNTDGDGQTQAVAQEYAARYIVEPRIGLSRARNRALLESKSEIIAFLDDDAVPTPRWLNHLSTPFKEDRRVAAVTGSTTSSEGSECHIVMDPARSVDDGDEDWFVMAGFGGLGIGANMALRKSACSEPGTFDERLGRGSILGGGEESEAFVKLLTRGYRIVHEPYAIVKHPDKPIDVEKEASRAIAYWLLLFFEFPDHRLDLLRFLLNRLRHKPLTWHRTSPNFGPIITSGLGLRIRACMAGVQLYFKARQESANSDLLAPL